MSGKSTIADWLKGEPIEGADRTIDSTIAGVGDVPAVVESAAEAPTPQKNFAKLSPDISFINGIGEQEGAYYAMVQGHKITRNNTRMRIFLIYSIIDIDTNDAAGLRRIIYQRQHSEIKAGENYEGVKVKNITFTDMNNVPPMPA